HAVVDAGTFERRGVFLADERILHPIGYRGPALVDVHRGVIDMRLAGRTWLAPRRIGAEPGGQAERLLGDAEMLVVPARAARRCRNHADRLVIDALHLVCLAVLPRRQTGALGPGVGVPLTLEADQHRRRGVRVRLGIAAVLVLADPQI